MQQRSAWAVTVADLTVDRCCEQPFCKRVVIDNEWFETLRRDDVTLVTDPILGIEPDAIVTEQGERCDVDTIVYATGFKSNDFLVPMEITGTDGVTLRERWGREPRAYLGVVAPPSFPNLYMFYVSAAAPFPSPFEGSKEAARRARTRIRDITASSPTPNAKSTT